jgi:hypothetical protein
MRALRLPVVVVGSLLVAVVVSSPVVAAPAKRIWTQAMLDHVSTPVAIAVEQQTGMLAGDLFPVVSPIGLVATRLSAAPPTLLTPETAVVQQAEPYIVANPANPANLLAGAQEGRFADGGAAGNGSYASLDGGLTWSRALIPGVSAASGNAAYERATDPVVAFGPDGTAYYCSLGINITTLPGAIFVNRSTDGGVTWSAPSTVIASNTHEHFLDKEWMTVDTHAGSPFSGRVYVTWSDFVAPPGNPAGLKKITENLAWSDDGTHWSEPVKVSGGDTYNQGSQPLVAPDGTVHVVYFTFGKKDLRIVTSRDGGATWTNPKSVARVQPSAVAGIRTAEELASASIDPVTGAIAVVWQDGRLGSSHVFLTRSTDGGLSWAAPSQVNDGAAGDVQFTPAVAIRAGVTHVSWYDSRDGAADPTVWQMRFASSGVGNQTFGASIPIGAEFDIDQAVDTQRGRFLGDYNGVAATASAIHPVWVDSSRAQNDVWSAIVTP